MALKIACGQMEIITGRPDLNTKKMLQLINLARKESVDIDTIEDFEYAEFLMMRESFY